MMLRKYNAIREFKTEEEARQFAESVHSDSWGWMKEWKNGKAGKIVAWYVDYVEED